MTAPPPLDLSIPLWGWGPLCVQVACASIKHVAVAFLADLHCTTSPKKFKSLSVCSNWPGDPALETFFLIRQGFRSMSFA